MHPLQFIMRNIHLRVPDKVYVQIKNRATSEKRSLNQYFLWLHAFNWEQAHDAKSSERNLIKRKKI